MADSADSAATADNADNAGIVRIVGKRGWSDGGGPKGLGNIAQASAWGFCI